MTIQHLQIIKMQGETIFFLMNSLRNIQTKIAQGPNIHYYSSYSSYDAFLCNYK